MYILKGVSFAKGASLTKDVKLVKKVYSTNIFETWEVVKFEKDHYKPYVAHIFKYSLTGMFPLKREDLEAWCLGIHKINKNMQERMLDVRLTPCNENKVYEEVTNDNTLLNYILFEKTDGGMKLEDSCSETCAKDRICRYSLKNLARGIIRLFKISEESNQKYDVNTLLVKGVFYFGKFPTPSKIDDKKTPTSHVLTNIQKEIKTFLDNAKRDYKHYFMIIPFFKFFKPDDILALKPLTKEDIGAREKIQMYELGQFLRDIYTGLNEAPTIKINVPGDSFTPDSNKQSQDVVDIFFEVNKSDILDGQIYEDRYFGIRKDFAKIALEISQGKANKSKAKQNSQLLKGSFYEFAHKLMDYFGNSQFASLEEALKHNFLTGKVYINKIESDTGDVE